MHCIGLIVNLGLDNTKAFEKKSYNITSQVSSVDLNFQDLLEFNLCVGSFFIFFSIFIQYIFQYFL